MALFRDGLDNSARRVRAEMEQAEKHGARDYKSQKNLEAQLLEETGDEKFAHTYRNRGRLYDKIKVSLRTMDIIIGVIAALLVVAIIVGIALG